MSSVTIIVMNWGSKLSEMSTQNVLKHNDEAKESESRSGGRGGKMRRYYDNSL